MAKLRGLYCQLGVELMSCETCCTVERYGRRVWVGRRICIDCWKLKEGEQNREQASEKPSSGKSTD